MKVLWQSADLQAGEVEDYVRDAIRSASMATAETRSLRVTVWRGTAKPETFVPVTSWASDRAVAITFGGHVAERHYMDCLAIVLHDDDGGWIEYVVRDGS